MKIVNWKYFQILGLAALICAGIGCRERIADGGTETTNGTANGVAVYENGKPAIGASVLLRPSDYLADITPSAIDTLSKQWQVQTDETGKFRFPGLAIGRYTIEIKDGEARGAKVEFHLDQGIAHLTLLPDTLTATSNLQGTLKTFANARGLVTTVRVFGLERIAYADSLGAFILPDMPQGLYTLRINVQSTDFDSLDTAGIIVLPARVNSTGQLPVPFKGCRDYICDSLAVRAILDTNGKKAVRVDSVAPKDAASGRILALTLSYMDLIKLPAEVGALQALKILHAPGNRFTTLPIELLNLHALEILYLENNMLRELPARLGEMTSLKQILLNTNNLSVLPAGLGRLTQLVNLTVARTKLASLPDDLTEIKSLQTLELSSDSLTTLPNGIGSMTSLESLYFDLNKITKLPNTIINLKQLVNLSVNGNHLCDSIPAETDAWLSKYSKDAGAWKSRQLCP